MPRPGVDVLIVDDAAPGGPDFQTGRAFFVGATERGPTEPTEITSLGRFAAVYGGRAGGQALYDSVAAFFIEGGASLMFARASGSGAAAATIAFGGLTANARSAGTWGNGLAVRGDAPSTFMETALAAAQSAPAEPSSDSYGDDADDEPNAEAFAVGDPMVIVVSEDGTDVERSLPLTTAAEAKEWADSRSLRISFAGADDAALPAPGAPAVTLAGGTDDAPDAGDFGTALDLFNYGYGPGQVCAPGETDETVHQAIAAHCAEMQRCGIVDLPDTADAMELSGAVGALYGQEGARYVLAVAPPAYYPVGSVSGAVSVVPYSAIQAGMIARVDAQGNPAMPAAGANGVSAGAVGLTHAYAQADATELNDLGVTLAREMYGSVRTYGYRTAAGPLESNWLFFGESRTVMAVAHECAASAEEYLFQPIDGRGHVFSALAKDLVGICERYYALAALYGATSNDAYRVDLGPTVNTPDSIGRGEIHAVVKLRTSRDAEWVVVSIVKVPLDRPL